jgi:hypothetical protein
MQEIRRPLCMGRGAEDRALVVLQDFNPERDIGGMILPNLGGQVKIGRQEPVKRAAAGASA